MQYVHCLVDVLIWHWCRLPTPTRSVRFDIRSEYFGRNIIFHVLGKMIRLLKSAPPKEENIDNGLNTNLFALDILYFSASVEMKARRKKKFLAEEHRPIRKYFANNTYSGDSSILRMTVICLERRFFSLL